MWLMMHRNKIAAGSEGGARHDATGQDFSFYPDHSAAARSPSADLDAAKILNPSSAKLQLS
jgi:hypothetical protein